MVGLKKQEKTCSVQEPSEEDKNKKNFQTPRNPGSVLFC